MDITRYLTRKNIIIGSVSLIAVSVIIIVISILLQPRIENLAVTRLAFRYPVAFVSLSQEYGLVFSNGRSFINYKTSNSDLKTLTTPGTLPSIGTILLRPDGKGALFQTINHSIEDQLSSTLQQKSLPLDEPYWWYVDFAKNEYKIVTYPGTSQPAKFRTALWLSAEQFIGAEALETQTRLSVFEGSLDKLSYDYTVNGAVSSLAYKNNRLLYQSDNSLITSTLGKNDGQKILEKISVVQFSPTTDWAYIIESTYQNAELARSYLFNTVSNKKQHERNAGEVSSIWSADGKQLFFSDSQHRTRALQSINPDNQRRTEYDTSAISDGIGTVLFAQDGFFMVADSNAVLYAGGSQALTKFAIPNNFTAIVNGIISIEYFSQHGYFIATIEGDDTPQVRQKVDQLLKQKSITPETVVIKYVALPSVQRDGPR